MMHKDKLPDAKDIVAQHERFNTLCRNLFSSPQGKELMEHLTRIFVDIPLYQESDRETVYMVAQRDLIMELKSHTVEELPHVID